LVEDAALITIKPLPNRRGFFNAGAQRRIEMSRSLRHLPPHLSVFGVSAACFCLVVDMLPLDIRGCLFLAAVVDFDSAG
jgi:hypothetical protein